MKKLFEFKTKTIVATGLGAALFFVLFMYVKVPSPIPETALQTAYGVGGFFAAMFGPIAGGLIAFIGHALSDALSYGSVWWSWVIASGVYCFLIGLVRPKLNVEEGEFGKKDIILYNVYQVVASVISWFGVASILDIVVYAEPVDLAFLQGITATILNAAVTGVVGTLLLVLYSKTRAKKGSLSKEG